MNNPISVPRLLIAGTHSGVGKTSVTLALHAAFRRMGESVQPFKVGPDYLDPGYHCLATGRPSWPLDTWMLGHEGVQESFFRGVDGASIAITEGMMGLYDGANATDETGSTAEIAKLLQIPVLLVIDAAGLARSAGALVQGYRDFDPKVRLAGVIANRVAGEGHLHYIRPAIEELGPPLLGWLPDDNQFRLPERHLGLTHPGEVTGASGIVDRLGDQALRTFDLDRILTLAAAAPPLQPTGKSHRTTAVRSHVRIALAQDAAFCFYYPDNLALLRSRGAEFVPFSPIEDEELPAGIQGLYLGGGYPELHAAALSGNQRMIRSIRQAIADGMPTFAECGGFMYLCESLTLADGRHYTMAGVIPGGTVMANTIQCIGYREGTLKRDTVLGQAGERVRGHEFRCSRYQGNIEAGNAGLIVERKAVGYATDTLLASYIHIHLGSNPKMAEWFVKECAQYPSGKI
ncbi:MAG: cobyrinate a,c-diamide synthase [Armatimonadota bacterium]|nr:cobyrinate a,c-diamide synthase [Armatimonadota bacterium]